MHGVGICDCCHIQEDVAHIWSAHGIDDDCDDHNDKAIPMQFTGLLDKNGKEIYEGDVVRIHNYSTKWDSEPQMDWRVFSIVYNKCTWSLQNSKIYTPLADYDTNTLEPWDIEIIGNIFETPELLNENPNQTK